MKLKKVMAAVLVLLCTVCALAESAVITANTRVYQRPSTSSASIKVGKGTTVELLATNGAWALVEKNGVRAYMNKNQLKAAQRNPVAVKPDYSNLLKNAKPATITANTRVYQQPSTSSASIKVAKGMQVKLLTISGSWALVENSGVYAYIQKKYVSENKDYTAPAVKPQSAVITQNTFIFQEASTSSASAKVAKGTKVNLLAVNGAWALVEKSGVRAYMNKDHVSVVSNTVVTAPTPAPTPVPAPEQPDYSGLLASAKDGVFVNNGKVYPSAKVSDNYATVEKGTKVNLLAANDGWMLIERNGVYGFTDADNVTVYVAPTPTPKPTPVPAPENYLDSSKYTNEQKCYYFFTREMGLNPAAACGIMANIRKESNFIPTAGSSYYGLVQWGGGRKTNLINYCSKNGYDYTTLEGQLNFLYYELKEGYSNTVLKTLKSVSNSPEGAYEAAYEFCYKFERPANKASTSVSRGNLAKDTFFPKYA